MGSTRDHPDQYNKVNLIPWDAMDEKHYQRMYDQRIACGWGHEEVPKRKDKMIKGTKFLYWVVSRDLTTCLCSCYPNVSAT